MGWFVLVALTCLVMSGATYYMAEQWSGPLKTWLVLRLGWRKDAERCGSRGK